MKNKRDSELHVKYIVLFFVIIFIFSFIIYKIFYNSKLQWDNQDAIEQYYITQKKYGVPRIISRLRGGMAVWTKDKLNDSCFERIEILDESVAHCVPKPHRDFLYGYVNYEIPNDKVLEVISLSGSVSYDPLKKFLRARCGSEEANIATLYLATAIGNSRITLKEIQEKKLYKKTIVSTVSSQNVQIYYDKLCDSLKNQPGNPKWSGYFPLAFPEGCCQGYNPKLNECGVDGRESESFKTDKNEKTDKSKNGGNSEPVIV
jgi:hypothetical protein